MHLDPRLPHFRNPMLENVRMQVVLENLVAARDRAKANGLGPAQAAALNLQQADSFDAQARQAANCASATSAFVASDESLLQALWNPAYSALQCEGMFEACVCAVVQLRLGAIANRLTAEAFRCYEARDLW